jgi:hypothetical protein
MAKLEIPENSVCTECHEKIVKRNDNIPYFHLASGAIRCDNNYGQDPTSLATPKV